MTKHDFILRLEESARVNKKIIFFDSVFNLLILFIIFLIIFQWLGFHYAIVAAIILSIIISIILFLRKTKSYDVLKKISRKYPDFEESLETAYDNMDRDAKDNIIIKSLMADASNEMNSIDTETFFNKRQIIVKVFSIIFLSLLLLSLTFIAESIEIGKVLNYGYPDNYTGNETPVNEENPEENPEERNIFGNKTDISPEGEPVPLDIKAYYSENGGNLEYANIEDGNRSYDNIVITGERKEYKEEEILKEDPVLSEAIKEKYNRTQ